MSPTAPILSRLMHINHRYLLWKGQVGAGATILDYGCGAAETIEDGRRQGLDIFGADAFYEGGDRRELVADKGLLGDAVRIIENRRAPFDDGSLDLFVSNYVLEHVQDLDAVLEDVHQLLKPGGQYLTLFPAWDVWREDHCDIPLLHRFFNVSRASFWYALVLRSLGLVLHTEGKTRVQWTKDTRDDLDRLHCLPESDRDLHTLRAPFSNRPHRGRLHDFA